MILDTQVSLFQGSYDTTPIETLPLSAVLQRIQAGTYRLYVEHLRHLLATKGEKAYKQAKEQSLAFTPCCAMHTRAQKVPWGQKLISITGLVHLDCDDLDDPEGLKAKLAQQPTVRFAFVSPKGNGLKIGIAATGITDPKSYKHAWTVVSAMIQRTYPTVHVSVDEHVKYLNALCYVSYDPLLYMNGDAIPFVVPPPTAQPAPALRITDDTPDYSRVASAVAALPNNDAGYDTWLALGMALHSTGESWARALWDGWSRQSGKFDERKQENSWNSFDTDGATTIATLFYLATQAGWNPPRATLRGNGARVQTRTVPDMTQTDATPAPSDHVLPDYLRDHPDPRVRYHWTRIYRRTAVLKRYLTHEGVLP